MVTTTNGLLRLRGISGKDYSYNIFVSDVAGGALTFSTIGQAVAGSSNFIITPEPCMIADLSVTTGPTVIFNLVPYVNDVSSGQIIALANVINTLQNRSFPTVKISGGRKLTILQA
jgi:hypothetical protein